MVSDPFNVVGGISVGIPAIDVIDSNGNVVSNFLNLTGNVSAGNIYANNYKFANGAIFTPPAGGSNTQLQFNNQGTFAGIPNVTWNGNILNLGNISALSIGGGVNGYFLQTDGEGNLTWAQGGNGGGNGSPGGANTQVQFNDSGSFGGDSGFTYNKSTNILNVGNIVVSENINANTIDATGNITASYYFGDGGFLTNVNTNLANYVAEGNQSNITQVGNLVSLGVDGDIVGLGNLNISGLVSASGLSLSGNLAANSGTFTNRVIVGSNLTVNSSAVLRVLGNLNASGSANINLGTVGNIRITGGLNGYVLTTDGSGNLSWGVGGGGGNGTPGGGDKSVQFNDNSDFGGDSSFIYDSSSATLSVPQIRSNATANFAGASSVNLGSIGNLRISGGLNGYVLTTNGSGNLSWSAGGGGGNGTPGGTNTQVQFNDAGAFGGSAFFTYNDVTKTLQISGNLIANSTQIGSGIYKWATNQVYFATTSSTAPDQVLYSIPVSDISGVEFEIIATDPIGNARQFCKISSLYYSNTVDYNEYATLFVNGGVGNFGAQYFAGNLLTPPSLQLTVTPSTSNTTTYKMLITAYSP